MLSLHNRNTAEFYFEKWWRKVIHSVFSIRYTIQGNCVYLIFACLQGGLKNLWTEQPCHYLSFYNESRAKTLKKQTEFPKFWTMDYFFFIAYSVIRVLWNIVWLNITWGMIIANFCRENYCSLIHKDATWVPSLPSTKTVRLLSTHIK